MNSRIKLGEKEDLKDKLRVEEIRGTFILGLLAILISFRFKYEALPIRIGQTSYDLTSLIDITILLWFFYAVSMVLGVSEDILGKKWSEQFRNSSKIFLELPLFFMGIISLIIFINILTSYLQLTLVLIFAIIAYILILAIIAYNKRKELDMKIKKSKTKIL
jgi:hypothetical protein